MLIRYRCVMMCFLHISHFGPWICYGTWLTNTNIKINKTSQLSRVINKITEDLGAVLYNWFLIFVTYNCDQRAKFLDRLFQGNSSTIPSDDCGKKRSVQINGLVFPATLCDLQDFERESRSVGEKTQSRKE